VEITKLEDLPGKIGKELGASKWFELDQKRIDTFADVTEDHQFIHIDKVAAKQTPFGGTIAHGFLTLSMLAKMAEGSTIILEGIKMGINYGFEKVRFINPVRSGKKVRAHFMLKDAVEKNPGQYLLTYSVSVEIEGEEKPALVADWLAMQVV